MLSITHKTNQAYKKKKKKSQFLGISLSFPMAAIL